MKLTDLIQKLETLCQVHGDCDVVLSNDEGGYFEPEAVGMVTDDRGIVCATIE